jgi:hypothetical protein
MERARALLLLLGLFAGSGCGGDRIADADPAVKIAGGGGTVTSTDGKVSLVIPAGALANPVAITITPATVPAHARLIPGTAYTFQPDGLRFAVPARLTIRYDSIPAALVSQAAFAWLHHREGDDWVAVTGEPVDTLQRVLSGQITGFSQYGGAVSNLATAILRVGLQFSALLTNSIANNAITLLSSLSSLLSQQSDPAFQALAEPVLRSAATTACTAYTTALNNARDTPIADYQQLTTLLEPAVAWAGTIALLTDFAPCAFSLGSLDPILTGKFQEFVDFYIARLLPAVFAQNFDRLIDEVGFVLDFREQVHSLNIDASDARLQAEAQFPLMDALRKVGYAACRDRGEHEWLGKVLVIATAASYTSDELRDDLQYCATRIQWHVTSSDGSQNTNGELGGDAAPGTSHPQGSTQGVAAGVIELGGDMRAFRCPGGGFEPDELVVTMQGVEVHRRPAIGGSFFISPLQLDAATILAAAGIDPQISAQVPLVVSRASNGCGLYVQSADPLPLVTLGLDYPPPFGYSNDFSGTAGTEWSSPVVTTSPTGERFHGPFQSVTEMLTLSGLPSHNEAVIEFDFYVIGSLEGNGFTDPPDPVFVSAPDIFHFAVDGTDLKVTTFANIWEPPFVQSWPDAYPGGHHFAGTGATATDVLGYPLNDPSGNDEIHMDTRYHMMYTVAHSAGSLVFSISASGVTQDEMWGIDNVKVTVR